MDLTNIVKTMEIENYSTLSPPVPGICLVVALEAGFVDAGSLVCFSSEQVVNKQLKKDELSSTLFSQLAANKRHNRFTDPSDWYAFYRKVASQIGWVTQSFKPFERYVSFPISFRSSGKAGHSIALRLLQKSSFWTKTFTTKFVKRSIKN